MITDLASLLAPMTEEEFTRARADRQIVHVPASDTGRFAQLMGWEVLNELIERGQLPGENFRLMRNGKRVPKEWFAPEGRINGPALRALLRQPVTIVTLDIANLWSPMRKLVRRLEQQLGHNVVCGAIATLREGGAFQPHFDFQDLLLLQIAGSKHWQILGERALVPTDERSKGTSPPSEVVMEFTMRPGDLLYLPRGWWHKAESDEDSLHVGLHLATPQGIDFARWLMKNLEQEPLFLEDVPKYLGAQALAAYESRLKARFAEILKATSLDACLRADEQAVPIQPSLDLGNHAIAADPLTVVELMTRRMPHVGGYEHGEIELFGVKLDLTPAIKDVLELLRMRPSAPMSVISEHLTPRHTADAVQEAVATLDRHGLVTLRLAMSRTPRDLNKLRQSGHIRQLSRLATPGQES
jgi:hypothetical protein